MWIPYESMLEEGVVLGDGDLGDSVFNIAREIERNHPDMPVSLDIGERDYVGRPNQKESLRRLLQALG